MSPLPISFRCDIQSSCSPHTCRGRARWENLVPARLRSYPTWGFLVAMHFSLLFKPRFGFSVLVMKVLACLHMADSSEKDGEMPGWSLRNDASMESESTRRTLAGEVGWSFRGNSIHKETEAWICSRKCIWMGLEHTAGHAAVWDKARKQWGLLVKPRGWKLILVWSAPGPFCGYMGPSHQGGGRG